MYSKISSRAEDIISNLFFAMEKSKSSSDRIKAARTLLNKCLPDLKATEVSGKDGGPIKITVLTGDIPAGTGFVPPPATSVVQGSTPVQSTSVASESKKDDNSN
jgi:hypothetical protein